jgi:exonuclease SbcC
MADESTGDFPLESVELRDFQSHQHTEIEFHPGVTVIVGSSDKGKSAILRAIRWCWQNRPLGTSFVRQHSEGDTSVSLTVSGHRIVRTRTAKQNSYEVDGEAFEAMGSDVPEVVEALLGIGEINIQDQLDPHFGVLDPPSQLAAKINAATNLDRIDALLRELQSRSRAAKRKRDDAQEEANKVQAKLSNPVFKLLDDFEALCALRREAMGVQQEAQRQEESLMNLICQIGHIDEAAAKAAKLAGQREALDSLTERVGEKLSELESVTKAQEVVMSCLAALREAGERLKTPVRFVAVRPDLDKIKEIVASASEQLDSVSGSIRGVQGCLGEIERVSDLLDSAQRGEKQARSQKAEIVLNLQECPSCGQAFADDSSKQHCIQSLTGDR